MQTNALPVLTIIIILASSQMTAMENSQNHSTSILGQPRQTILNINNITTWVNSDGFFSWDTPSGGINGTYPRLTAGAVFSEGFLWGGISNNGQSPTIRVNGSTYASGLLPGAILGIGTGIVEDPSNTDVRIWRVRPDWQSADLSEEEWELFMSEEEIRQQYETDWNEWPAEKGAPYEDINDDGQYNPFVDIPGIPGAGQTIWYVANDINSVPLYGSPPIGIELQMTLWGYARPEDDPFGDMTFRRARIIYKGTGDTPSWATIDSMFISHWSDPDVGIYTDDYVGCDTILSLGYAYNGSFSDGEYEYFDLPPPVIGYQFIQGPIVPSPGDIAVFDFAPRPGFKNLPMTSFLWFAAGAEDSDPNLGTYAGSLQWYNLMLGLRPRPEYPNGLPWIDPNTGEPTAFPLSGNPLAGTGWIDGQSLPPGDRRMGFSSGPFTMALGDTQEVTVAFLGDIGTGLYFDYLTSINGLKRKANSIKGLLANRLAVAILGEAVVPLAELTELNSAWLSLDKSALIASYVWSLESVPEGSTIQLTSPAAESTSLTPDVEGDYRVSVAVTTTGGSTAATFIDIRATANQPPTAQFTIDHTDLTWGDSVLVNATGSSDPENDSLIYIWRGPGVIRLLDNGRQAQFSPFRTGSLEIELTVFDGIFESVSTQSVMVHPRLENMTIDYSFVDSSWFRETYFFLGNTLLVPIQKLGIIRVYNVMGNGIDFSADISLPGAIRVVGLEDNLLYVLMESESAQNFGVGNLSIYAVGAGWQLTPLLEGYRPGDTDIFNLVFLDDYVLVRDSYNIFKMNLTTNPSTPQIVAQVEFLHPDSGYPMRPSTVVEVGGYLFVHIPDMATLEVLNKSTLEKVTTLSGLEGLRNFSVHDTQMFVGYPDTLVIYGLSDPLSPIKINSISLTPPSDFVAWYSYHSGTHIENNLLSVDAYGGFTVFDITDPS
ncbi:MAG: hypothetical protein IIA60_12750, partial [Candidatus Marinimicrobia bacterium]|nr:hypothetical protein [Candidatus Neomarinimicrobiota bacterium]